MPRARAHHAGKPTPDGTVKEFLEALEKIAVAEQLDEDHIVVAEKRRDWVFRY